MSREYNIIALGNEDFVFLFGMCGLDYKVIKNQSDAIKYINKQQDFVINFIIDEDIITDITEIENLEKAECNITVLKSWGTSEIANNKIRKASIKAIGIDMAKQGS